MRLASIATSVAAAIGTGLAAAPPQDADAEKQRNAYAVQLSFRVADCVVDHNRRDAIALLRQVAGSTGERKALRPIGQHVQRCYRLIGREDSRMSMPVVIIRAQIAEALFRRDFGPGRNQSAPARLPPFDPSLTASPDPSVRRSALASGFASCVAAALPEESAVLLNTSPYSPEEQTVIDRLLPVFSGCMPAGAQLQINYPLFRGFVAEALYRQRAGARP
jgi:hypothetical protein